MATDGGMIEGTKPTTEAARGKDDQEGQPKVPEKTGNPALMLSREDVGLLGITAVSLTNTGYLSRTDTFPNVHRQAISWTVRRSLSITCLERRTLLVRFVLAYDYFIINVRFSCRSTISRLNHF